MNQLKGGVVSIEAPDGGAYEAYIAGDTGAGRPALLIFTPIFGIDEDMRAIADEWAAQGYLVGVPDYFFRVAPGPLGRAEEGRKQAFARWEKLDVDRAIEDVRPLGARLVASSACNGRLGAIGYCAGGELAFLSATRLGAEAVATFHATRIERHLSEAGNLRGALSLHYGGNDPLVPMSEVSQVQQCFKDDGRVEIAVYPGAGHGFSFRGRPSYHESAATHSRAGAAKVLSRLKKPVHVT
jgi:carboxymethylenebutenolidase